MKKWWIKLLLAIAVVVVLFAVWLSVSSVHSKSAVERYRDQLRAAGEKLEFNDVLPPHVDPDKNGLEFFTRAFSSIGPVTDGMLNTNSPSAMRMVAPGKAMVGWQEAEIITDFTSPSGTNTWADLDQQLQLGSAVIDLLRQGAERPQLDFQLDYGQGPTLQLPHLMKMKQAALLFSPAALADLHRGDAASAATNIHTMLLILNAWKDEPLLISQLVRIAMAHIAIAAQWEFLQGTNITDQQLAMLERDWADAQFVQPMEQSLTMERVWGTRNIELLRSSNSPSSYYSSVMGPGSSGGGGSSDWLDTLKDMRDSMKRKTSDTLWRVSWSYDDELNVLRGDQILIETMREVRTNGFFKNALADRDRKLAAFGLNRPGTNWLRNHLDDDLTMLGAESVQGLGRAIERVQMFEAARAMTITAIALKRYQLRHGTLPPDLNALVPEFLADVPRDPVDGHSLRYRSNGDGTFVLYSIGSDGVDNAGDPTGSTGARSFNWLRGRDWVWPQPATRREIEFFRANPPN